MSGYDKYLEYQFGWSGSFYKALFEAMHAADASNLARLSKGFPKEAEAYEVWTCVGRDAFLSRCSPDHPLVHKIQAGEAEL